MRGTRTDRENSTMNVITKGLWLKNFLGRIKASFTIWPSKLWDKDFLCCLYGRIKRDTGASNHNNSNNKNLIRRDDKEAGARWHEVYIIWLEKMNVLLCKSQWGTMTCLLVCIQPGYSTVHLVQKWNTAIVECINWDTKISVFFGLWPLFDITNFWPPQRHFFSHLIFWLFDGLLSFFLNTELTD